MNSLNASSRRFFLFWAERTVDSVRPVARSVDRPSAQARCRSTSGRSRGEVEPVGAGGAGGFEVGAGPVAGLGGQLGVEPAGLGAVAVVLVIGQEPRQVAQLGPGAGGDRASAVAIGAERRAVGERRVAKLVDVGLP